MNKSALFAAATAVATTTALGLTSATTATGAPTADPVPTPSAAVARAKAADQRQSRRTAGHRDRRVRRPGRHRRRRRLQPRPDGPDHRRPQGARRRRRRPPGQGRQLEGRQPQPEPDRRRRPDPEGQRRHRHLEGTGPRSEGRGQAVTGDRGPQGCTAAGLPGHHGRDAGRRYAEPHHHHDRRTDRRQARVRAARPDGDRRRPEPVQRDRADREHAGHRSGSR